MSKPAASWLLTIAVAVVLFLLTRNPLMASILPYLRAGWPAFRSALWLRRYDPLAGRGRTCLWFYLATAGWKAGTAALLTVLALRVLQDISGQGVDTTKLVPAAVIVFGGVLRSVLLGVIGIASALFRRVRVFVIPNICSLCHGQFQATSTVASQRHRFNHAIFIVATSLVLPVVATGVGLLVAFSFANPNKFPVVPAVAGFGLIGLGPFAMIPVYGYCSSRIIARTPRECWEPDVSHGAE